MNEESNSNTIAAVAAFVSGAGQQLWQHAQVDWAEVLSSSGLGQTMVA
jgi:hypothetical protein